MTQELRARHVCCLMERQDSAISHSLARAECPKQPSATILAVGEVAETTQSLGFLLLSRRETKVGQSTLSTVESCNLVTREPNKDNLYCQVSGISKDRDFTASLGIPSTPLLLLFLKTEKMSLPQNTLEATVVGISRHSHSVWIWDFPIAYSKISDLPIRHLDCLGVKVE